MVSCGIEETYTPYRKEIGKDDQNTDKWLASKINENKMGVVQY